MTQLEHKDIIITGGMAQLRNIIKLCATSELSKIQIRGIISRILNERNIKQDGKQCISDGKRRHGTTS